MRRIMPLINVALLISIISLPFGKLVSYLFGYSFELTNYSAHTVVMTFISLLSAVVTFLTKNAYQNRFIDAVFILITPFALINIALYLVNGSELWVVAVMTVFLICCIYLTVRYGKPPVIKALH